MLLSLFPIEIQSLIIFMLYLLLTTSQFTWTFDLSTFLLQIVNEIAFNRSKGGVYKLLSFKIIESHNSTRKEKSDTKKFVSKCESDMILKHEIAFLFGYYVHFHNTFLFQISIEYYFSEKLLEKKKSKLSPSTKKSSIVVSSIVSD